MLSWAFQITEINPSFKDFETDIECATAFIRLILVYYSKTPGRILYSQEYFPLFKRKQKRKKNTYKTLNNKHKIKHKGFRLRI